MTWPFVIEATNAVLIEHLGEPVTLRTSDGAQTLELRGIYDARPERHDANGSTVIQQDHRITVLSTELPAWALGAISAEGLEATIRTEVLRVHELHADGQGITVLGCGKVSP